MTNEKAIKILNEMIEYGWLISDMDKCLAIEALDMAIQSLKQTDGDLISREKVEQYLATLLSDYLYDAERIRLEKFEEWLSELPAYSSEVDISKWICIDAYNQIFECIKCGRVTMNKYPYCPFCRAKMEESEEEDTDQKSIEEWTAWEEKRWESEEE